MTYVFYEVHTPAETRMAHAASGGEELTQHAATLKDGMLRVMSAKEPVEPGKLMRHVSISVGPMQGPPTRKPTDQECKEVLSLWSAVDFGEEVYDHDERVRHFWEM